MPATVRLLALGLTMSACATPSLETSARLAVGSVFSCYVCGNQPICSVPLRQIVLPGADRLDWTDLRRIAANSEQVCALVGTDLHCWDYVAFREDEFVGDFTGPSVEHDVVAFDLENRALCTVSRGGRMRCSGRARVVPELRADPLELTLGSSREIDVAMTEHGVEDVALHFAGACRLERGGRAVCWRWDGEAAGVETPNDMRVEALWTVATGIELWTDSGVVFVEMPLHSWKRPLEAVPVAPELPARTWVHAHGAACRVLEGDMLECRATGLLDRNETDFNGWPAPPQCARR